jgi:hypothetical protein
MKFLPILLLFAFNVAFGQSYTFSYNDPCTGVLKSLVVPSNGITVSYYGQINTFNPIDFQNGNFQSWTQNIKNSYGNLNPCASIVGLGTSLDVAQTTALNTLGIINSISSIADIASSMGGSLNTTSSIGSINSSTSNNGKSNSKNDKKNNSSSGGNTPNGASTTTQGGQTTETGSSTQGSQTSGGGQTTETGSSTQGSQTSAGQSSENNGTSQSSAEAPKTEESTKSEEGGQSNVLGGTTNSVQRSTEKNGGNAPTIVLSSDFAGFNFKDSDVNFGGKGTAGYTSVRWDGKRTHGVMADYTSAMNGPNITAFYGFLGEKRIDLISVTGSFGFTGLGSRYVTLAFGQMWNFKKPKNLKLIYMLTGSFGTIHREQFIGTAAIAGGMYDLKVGKRLDIKFTNLFIYAPFVSYYDDVVLSSPYVIMPLVGANVGVTKKFKLSVNFGGTYALNKDVMNFTVMFGTRIGL